LPPLSGGVTPVLLNIAFGIAVGAAVLTIVSGAGGLKRRFFA
jgi:hypothetical protein